MTANADPAVVETLLKLEQERCRALDEQDWPALDAILGAEYTHTHTNGNVQPRAEYMVAVNERPRVTTRRDLAVRVYPGAAVMSGIQVQKTVGSGDRPPSEAAMIQVWILQGNDYPSGTVPVTIKSLVFHL